jgi:hypothetical protein
MKKLIHSPAPWFTNQYGGIFLLTDTDTYENKMLLDVDKDEGVGEDIAQSNAIIASKAPDMYKALFGVLHHNDNVKEQFKLPKSLIEQITTILKDIETYKEELNT